MNNNIKAALLCLFSLCSTPVFADTESDVLEVVVDNFKALENEDIASYMDTIHNQSALYQTTENVLKLTFKAYDLKYDLKDVVLVGEDDKYAYAKVVFETHKVRGPAFQDNQIESLIVFKQINGDWKIWAQANLELTKLDAKPIK
ncbi:hypothetical protein [Vibrio gangliei]|uniref:hypothetical protein n=1 Tax=Vibrio gangliei TaxID=2077090 RepID=UPI000D0198B1|nr:hypothetical protein [Vibrio gangliei]